MLRHKQQDALRKRENDLVAKIARARNLDVTQTAMMREEIKKDLRDHAGNYERLRHNFLMLDLYPENSGKFGLTYDKCKPESLGKSF
jgi:hypothetical protein